MDEDKLYEATYGSVSDGPLTIHPTGPATYGPYTLNNVVPNSDTNVWLTHHPQRAYTVQGSYEPYTYTDEPTYGSLAYRAFNGSGSSILGDKVVVNNEPIYSYGRQQSKRLTYTPPNQVCAPFQPHEDCSSSKNSMGGDTIDWSYGWLSCCSGFCPAKRTCAKPDLNECSIGQDLLLRNPATTIEWDGQAPNYRCTYDGHKINTLEQINNYEAKYNHSKDYKENVDKIMARFCSGSTGACPIGSDGKAPIRCSRLKGLDAESSKCRAWIAAQSVAVRDAVMDEYCLHYPNHKDCSCIHRAHNPTYTAAKQNNPYNDGCWYLPCLDSNNLIKSDVVVGKDGCPREMCQVIYDLNRNNNVVVHDNQDIINCNFNTLEPHKEPQPPPIFPEPKPYPLQPPVMVMDLIRLYGIYVVTVAAVVILFVLLIRMRQST